MGMSLRYTTADLECLPAIEGVRYEIIDGDLYVSRQPDWHHQYASSRVAWALHEWDNRAGLGVAIEAPGIIFASDDNVAPDLVWLTRTKIPHIFDEAGHLRAAPDLVVEILSAGSENERRDRELKLKLYSRQGVREYWIVDWQLESVQVYRRQGTALVLVETLAGEDVLSSPMLPDFACPLRQLWAPRG
jgi:Uma2 family endonuclease